MFKRLIALFVIVSFILSYNQPIYAQDFSINQLPMPGTMIGETAPFSPLALKGLVINIHKPLEFQFIVDTGRGPQDTAAVKSQANQLVKYFLAGLTIPEGDLWVNLSPYEKNLIIPEVLGQTDLGRDLLAQDYILKQLTASLIYPEKDLGKEFWGRVYAKAQQQFGTTNVPVNTFNKVWILPDQAQVFENRAAAYVTKATLKVMLDEDYLAKQKHQQTQASSISSQIVREIVIPEITKEVNTGKNFGTLRQIYDAMILAKWYKETIQNGLLDAIYTNKMKVAGVNLSDPAVKEQIYDRYLQAYKKGVFNYIKEDSISDGQVIPRKYFSGGLTPMPSRVLTDGAMSAVKSDGEMMTIDVNLKEQDHAMFTLKDEQDISKFNNIVNGYSNKNNSRTKLTLQDVEPARAKFDYQTKEATPFEGNTVIIRFDRDTHEELVRLKHILEDRLKETFKLADGREINLHDKVAFVKDDSIHLTIYDLVNPDDLARIKIEHPEYANMNDEQIKNVIIAKVREAFQELGNEGKLKSITLEIKKLGAFAPFLLLSLVNLKDQQNLEIINAIRQRIFEKTKIRAPWPFVSHITLGYIVNPMDEEEYAQYKKVVNEVMQGMKISDTIVDLKTAELSNFPTMDEYNKVFDANYAMSTVEDTVLNIADPRSSQISLVGGKAASLKELGSIPGIDVPAGFNVTTKVYTNYLEKIGTGSYISELEDLSEQWKTLKENDPVRETMTVRMRKLSEKIQNLIISGEISPDVRNLILASYKKLEKNGQPALVAVRSSATAEDMPGASFAGQYSTYLNQQGDDQVIDAIKKVWASTYNMNAVEYRNKQNMQHSKNKMCALVLEMVNPQSAGTAFTVDLETGAPFISINNTYGLGEAEVAGIVTSDTWIVDPKTGTIIKRRLGEKGKKIVYDPNKKSNVTVDTSDLERQRFAITTTIAKRIADLVNRIQEHYVKKNPSLNHMDIEYAVTDDGHIIFTQARPETVWTTGNRLLIAIDSKKIDQLNKQAEKAGSKSPYPEIFKGGVSGSSGIARGVLRVVSTVEEAEEFVKPGDIIVAPNTTNAWEHVMGRTSGIITEIGGPGNHTAVVSREQKKSAIVGAVGAMENLRIYAGQFVTVDATSKRVYLNNVPEDFVYMPDKVEPEYGSLYSQTLDESWKEAQDTNTTTQGLDGTRWISKPNQKVRGFIQAVFTRSHHQVADMLHEPIEDRINFDTENPNVGVYQVKFDTIYPWMVKLAEKPLEGPGSLSAIQEERVANIRDFLQKSNDLTLTSTSVKAWIDSFITLNAYMGFAYNMYRITEGLLQNALKEKQTLEPYLSQVWLSMAAWVGETEAIERNRDYARLLEDVKKVKGLHETLDAIIKTGKDFDTLASQYPEFYARFNDYVFNYKVMRNTDDIFTSDPFHMLVAKDLLKDVQDNRSIGIYGTKPEQFYPEDPQFTRIARLAFLSEKLRQDAHHFKVRGQWKFVEVLRPLAKFLITRGEIKAFGDVFDHTPEWIAQKVEEYEKAGLPSSGGEYHFHAKDYQIQDLAVTDDAMLTSMGRWTFDSVQWDETTGKLMLLNATRIELAIKPEFAVNGQNSPREIALSTRRLNEQEHEKIDGIVEDLGLDTSKIIVIKLDQAAAFHRIYGLYANGISFIREDILSEGNQDQIHEALDHLRLKTTGLGYEDLKKIQFYGNLRGLITRLSHKTIKEKLLFELYGAQEVSRIINESTRESIKDAIIKAILNQLSVKESEYHEQLKRFESDVNFYDQVSREMVRNKVGFVGALGILGHDPAMIDQIPQQIGKDKAVLAKDLGGIDFNQINVNRNGKTIVVQFDPAQLSELQQNNFNGFTPVITDFKYIQSPFPLLGVNPAKELEVLAKV